MTREEYEWWCQKLARCPSSGKVEWPLRNLAEQAAQLFEGPNPGAYKHDTQYGCGNWHVTRDLQDRPSRGQRQRRNQPDTVRIKQARQKAARRERER